MTVRSRAKKFNALIGPRRSPVVDEWRAVMEDRYEIATTPTTTPVSGVHRLAPRHA